MQTITEDGPDVESLRLLHGLMQERYGQELVNKISKIRFTFRLPQTNSIIGMDTTLEQGFFYYAASSWCSQDVQIISVHRKESILRPIEHNTKQIPTCIQPRTSESMQPSL